MITTVLLDAGGVLVDESEIEAARAEATVRSLAGRVPGYSVERYFEDIAEAVRVFVPEAYLFVFHRHLGADPEGCEAAYLDFLSAWREECPPLRIMPGIREEVEGLARRFRVGIAGQYGAELLDLLDREGVSPHLSWRFTQDDFAITKPDPRYLLQIAAACGVDPVECVMVGDRVDKDVIPAKQVGMRTVRIRLGLHRDQEPRTPREIPDRELPSVVGLARVVEELAG